MIIHTSVQIFTSFVLSCWATKMYLPVYLIRIDEPTGGVFLFAGEEIEVLISREGT